MSITGFGAPISWEVGNADPMAPATSKFELDKPNDSGTNAFAATLASVMAPPAPPPPKPRDDEAKSDLDARTTGVTSDATSDKPAFAAAAEARSAAADAPVTQVNSDTEALSPDFRARLGRVVSRMHDEYGHDVQLVEGYRNQSRQDFLYEQGRTRPGEVVTWTKSSKHSQGVAADLVIDGSYDNPQAYQRLAQIASQEGLKTLGSRDPGHIELPTRNGSAAWGASADQLNIDGGLSRAVGLALSPDATTQPGSSSSDANNLNGFLSRFSRNGSQVQALHTGSSGNGAGGSSMSGDTSRDGLPNRNQPQVAQVAHVASVADVAAVAGVARVADLSHVTSATLTTSAHSAAPMTGIDSAERVGRMLDVRDATPAAPLSHLTLNLDGGTGTGDADRITVQLRGNSAVDTTIALGDSNRADKMSLRVGELQQALEQQGLESASISVASTGTETSAGWTPRQGADHGGNGRQTLNHRESRQDADETRHRSRREQQGGNK